MGNLDHNTVYYIWLSEIAGLSQPHIAELISEYGTARAAAQADGSEIGKRLKLPPVQVKRLSDKSLKSSDRILAICEKRQIDVIRYDEERYPERLREIYNPPTLLYVRGKLPPVDDGLSIAMVGHRKPTLYGVMSCEKVAYHLSKSGVVVVSGMAEGIDSAAHRGALAGGTPTIAVLGTAIDRCYPRSNIHLMEDIMANGAVISERPPGARTTPNEFPRRNRIISGLSLGTVVVEAPERSGSLITADWALEQNRDIFAVPGNMDMGSFTGSNRLIQQGGKLVLGAVDILSEYAHAYPETLESARQTEREPEYVAAVYRKKPEEVKEKKKPNKALSQEMQLLELLESKLTADELAEQAEMDIALVKTHLTMMELSGQIRRLPGEYFQKI